MLARRWARKARDSNGKAKRFKNFATSRAETLCIIFGGALFAVRNSAQSARDAMITSQSRLTISIDAHARKQSPSTKRSLAYRTRKSLIIMCAAQGMRVPFAHNACTMWYKLYVCVLSAAHGQGDGVMCVCWHRSPRALESMMIRVFARTRISKQCPHTRRKKK